jgi:hypothetical protein
MTTNEEICIVCEAPKYRHSYDNTHWGWEGHKFIDRKLNKK